MKTHVCIAHYIAKVFCRGREERKETQTQQTIAIYTHRAQTYQHKIQNTKCMYMYMYMYV